MENMVFLSIYLVMGLLILGLMTLLWLVSLALKNSSIVSHWQLAVGGRFSARLS